MRNKNNKIGIFGGSFDPPHKGHLHISNVFLKAFNLQKVIWSVSKTNPLIKKNYYYNYNQRIELIKKITKNSKKVFINNFDKKFSFQLVNGLKKKFKNKTFFFLVGTDNIKNFHKWKNYEKILKMTTVVFISRPGYESGVKRSIFFKRYKSYLLKKYDKSTTIGENSWFYIKDKGLNISSSNIKNRLYKNNNS